MSAVLQIALGIVVLVVGVYFQLARPIASRFRVGFLPHLLRAFWAWGAALIIQGIYLLIANPTLYPLWLLASVLWLFGFGLIFWQPRWLRPRHFRDD